MHENLSISSYPKDHNDKKYYQSIIATCDQLTHLSFNPRKECHFHKITKMIP